jgi:WD40 repeat protein
MYRKSKEFKGHSGAVYSLAYDGSFLYSGAADGFVARWNLQLGTQDKFSIKLPAPVYSIALIQDNQLLVVGLATGAIHVFDIQKRIEVKFFTQHIKAIFAISENKLTNHFYVGDADGNLSVWDSLTLELVIYLPLDCGKIRRINVNESGTKFALAGQDGNIRVFETLGFNEINTIFAHENGASALLFLNENELISGGKDALLKRWDLMNNKCLSSIPAHNFVLYDFIYVAGRENVVSASRDKSMKIWNPKDLSFQYKIDTKEGGHRHSVNCLINLESNSFASTGDDKRIIIWTKID